MKFTSDSPAMALANKVLPVPGPPDKRTPLQSLAPLSKYSFEFLIYLIRSSISFLISSIPLTSANLSFISVAFLISNLNLSFYPFISFSGSK
jgi:hypothetical protein